jgi:dihydroceramidase
VYVRYEMGHQGSWNTRSYATATLLTVYPSTVSMVYIVINDPTFHEVAYGLMVVVLTIQGFYCLKVYSSWKYLTLATLSVSIYTLGFILWNIDNTFCPDLREFRLSSPPLGALSQFHAWWHVFAGMGTYLHIAGSSRVRMDCLKYKTKMTVSYILNAVPVLLCTCTRIYMRRLFSMCRGFSIA